MALTKAAVVLLASGSATAGGTRASPGLVGAGVDIRAYYGALVTWKITNGASAPGVAVTLAFQTSSDNATWADYMVFSGNIVASSVVTGSLDIVVPAMYIRLIAFGNTTNNVTVESGMQVVTAL